MECVLLVGGAGFIGSYVADKLVSEGYNVVVVDNLLIGTERNIQHLYKNANFKFIKSDFSSLSNVDDIFAFNKFDIVFHLAANSDIQASEKDPTRDLNNTFMTTAVILECMRNYNVKKLLFSSTSAIYGDMSGVKICEDAGPLLPISYYGGAKLASEAYISAYSYMNNIQSWIFRFPNVIGERLTHGAVYDFINRLRNNPNELKILGDGKQTKPYLYINDLVNAMFLIWKKARDQVNYYNIGVDTRTSVNEIADIVCEELELKDVKYVYTGGRVGWKGDVPEFQYDLSKVYSLGWRPSLTSNEAVRISARGYIKNEGGNNGRRNGNEAK